MADNPNYFDEEVQGKLKAELKIADGHPQYKERDGLRHYQISLSLETDNPSIASVVYRLDPSYYNSVRESSNPGDKFRIHTTTYGDYYLDVDAQVGSRVVRDTVLLSNLLRKAHGDSDNPEVQEALQYIKGH